jgi:hypothetical protein
MAWTYCSWLAELPTRSPCFPSTKGANHGSETSLKINLRISKRSAVWRISGQTLEFPLDMSFLHGWGIHIDLPPRVARQSAPLSPPYWRTVCATASSNLVYPLQRIFCWPLVFSTYDLCYILASLFFFILNFSVIVASETQSLNVVFLHEPHFFFIVTSVSVLDDVKVDSSLLFYNIWVA